jgi:hypothetical protein
MNAPFRPTEPADQVAEAARVLRKRRGRPVGSFKPLGRWLRLQIAKYKRQGETCINTFRALSLVEGGDDDGFVISDETGESWLYDLGANIAGKPVSYEGFRKAWQRQ